MTGPKLNHRNLAQSENNAWPHRPPSRNDHNDPGTPWQRHPELLGHFHRTQKPPACIKVFSKSRTLGVHQHALPASATSTTLWSVQKDETGRCEHPQSKAGWIHDRVAHRAARMKDPSLFEECHYHERAEQDKCHLQDECNLLPSLQVDRQSYLVKDDPRTECCTGGTVTHQPSSINHQVSVIARARKG